ncbi:MAG: DUF4214 domain-containing protein [Pseudomonadota bacterium]
MALQFAVLQRLGVSSALELDGAFVGALPEDEAAVRAFFDGQGISIDRFFPLTEASLAGALVDETVDAIAVPAGTDPATLGASVLLLPEVIEGDGSIGDPLPAPDPEPDPDPQPDPDPDPPADPDPPEEPSVPGGTETLFLAVAPSLAGSIADLDGATLLIDDNPGLIAGAEAFFADQGVSVTFVTSDFFDPVTETYNDAALTADLLALRRGQIEADGILLGEEVLAEAEAIRLVATDIRFDATIALPPTPPTPPDLPPTIERETIRIVGSSTAAPAFTVIAETFATTTGFRTPIVESTGTGIGFSLFSSDPASALADIVLASRRMTQEEFDQATASGVSQILELPLATAGPGTAETRVYAYARLDILETVAGVEAFLDFLVSETVLSAGGLIEDGSQTLGGGLTAAQPDELERARLTVDEARLLARDDLPAADAPPEIGTDLLLFVSPALDEAPVQDLAGLRVAALDSVPADRLEEIAAFLEPFGITLDTRPFDAISDQVQGYLDLAGSNEEIEGIAVPAGDGAVRFVAASAWVDTIGLADLASPFLSEPGADGLFDEQEIALLYEVALGREPETDGLNFWIDEAYRDGGLSVLEIAAFFFESDELRDAIGADPATLGNADLVEFLYANVLDRDGLASENDPDGFAFWLGVAESGTPRPELLRFFAISGENVANSAYVADLDRGDDGAWAF